MQHLTLKEAYAKTIAWYKGNIVDWKSGGQVFSTDGKKEAIGTYYWPYGFDTCIISPDGTYVFLYQKLGTKGVLLKNGELMREINRTFYHADTYEFPAAFITAPNGQTYLAHCPIRYNRLDFEDVETGKIVTDIPDRNPDGFFHSRLEVNPSHTHIMSKGWLWHPIDFIAVFDVGACLKNPKLLDTSNYRPQVNCDINTASFISDNRILVGASNISEPFDEDANDLLNLGQIGIWDLDTDNITGLVQVKGEFGNLYAINEKQAFDLYKYPKIIHIESGEIEQHFKEIQTGTQHSSIIYSTKNLPAIAFNREIGAIAIKSGESSIEIIQ